MAPFLFVHGNVVVDIAVVDALVVAAAFFYLPLRFISFDALISN